jgi:diacylglycerol kinase family enzyme
LVPGIGIILNRNAGKKRAFRGQIGEKLAFVLGDPGSLKETNSIDEIDDVAKTFLDREIDILGIGGGDGSNHYTLSTFIKIYGERPLPRVAFLCGGTHNAHAYSIGVKGKPEKLLEEIMRRYHTKERFDVTRRKVLRVDDGKGIHYGFSMATGFMYRFYRELHIRQDDSQLKVAGLLASWFGSWLMHGKKIREVFRLEPGKITVSGETLPWEVNNGLSCSTMEKLGMGFTPYPRANETLKTFQMGAFKIKPRTFARIMWIFKGGGIPVHPDHFNDITDHVVLEAEKPISYVFDGEIYHGGNRLEIRTGPPIDILLI